MANPERRCCERRQSAKAEERQGVCENPLPGKSGWATKRYQRVGAATSDNQPRRSILWLATSPDNDGRKAKHQSAWQNAAEKQA